MLRKGSINPERERQRDTYRQTITDKEIVCERDRDRKTERDKWREREREREKLRLKFTWETQ